MTPEQRQEVIRLLQQGQELSPEWARILYPPEKREYELVYHGKEREEDILANTLAVPLQPARTFGKNGDGWHNLLIFGDNLQVMKSLLEMKEGRQSLQRQRHAGRAIGVHRPPLSRRCRISRVLRIRRLIKTRLPVRHSLNSFGNGSFSFANG
jgi:site-specific DNA-methyltransferase (adenine-specific)/adenine-specific DNA-methyltransferase